MQIAYLGLSIFSLLIELRKSVCFSPINPLWNTWIPLNIMDPTEQLAETLKKGFLGMVAWFVAATTVARSVEFAHF